MKLLLKLFARIAFGFRAYNVEALNAPGPVLLISNHQSMLDWLFLLICVEEDWKFVASEMASRQNWLHRRVVHNRRTFLIDTTSPYSLKHMAEYLERGGRLILFSEGRLSRTGSLMKLFDGSGFLLHKTRARVVTCYLRGVERLQSTMHGNKRQWFPRVTAHFSEVQTPPKLDHVSTSRARTELTAWLRDRMVAQQFETEMKYGSPTVPGAVYAIGRTRPSHVVLEDATRQALTYRRLMTAVELMSEPLRRSLRDSSAQRVGVLLPNMNAVPVILLALWAIGRIPAILNYSTGAATMLACAQLAGLKHVVTSRTFLDRAKLNVAPLTDAGIELLYLEDIRESISTLRKISAAVVNAIHPGARLSDSRLSGNDSALILFTSGSEGVPKGVELTHTNIVANIRQLLAIADIEDRDRVFNALPMFHSFGITIGTFFPMVRGIYAFIYPSPLHYRAVPAAFYDRDCTIMIGTNTFLNGYARKAHPYDFRSLRYMFAGAEKVQEATANLWSQRYGVRILEGYGATECSPCISLNVPMTAKGGSAGRLLPHIEYKLEPIEGVSEGGRLLVRGPNVMRGYLNTDANERFKSLGGWYDTGDIVSVDAEGFVHILGRLKRFAKVSGEMVSLTAVEDALAGAFPQYGLRCQIAVLSRPDEGKGEVLIAVTNEPKLHLEEVRIVIKAKGLTNLCVPREIKVVKEIPKLGTGKVNHRELARLLVT